MLRLRFYALEIHLNVCQHSLEYGNQLNKQHKKLTNRCDKDNMFHSRRPRSMFMCVLAFFCSSHSLGINLFCGVVSSMLPLTNCCRRMASYLENLSDFVLFFKFRRLSFANEIRDIISHCFLLISEMKFVSFK